MPSAIIAFSTLERNFQSSILHLSYMYFFCSPATTHRHWDPTGQSDDWRLIVQSGGCLVRPTLASRDQSLDFRHSIGSTISEGLRYPFSDRFRTEECMDRARFLSIYQYKSFDLQSSSCPVSGISESTELLAEKENQGNMRMTVTHISDRTWCHKVPRVGRLNNLTLGIGR